MRWAQLLREFEEGCAGAVLLDEQLVIRAVSDGTLVASGHEREDIVGMSAVDVVHPDDLDRAAEVLAEVAMTPGARPDGLYRLRFKDGTYRQYAVRATNLGPSADNLLAFQFSDPDPGLRASALADDAVLLMGIMSEELPLAESVAWVERIAERHVEEIQLVVTIFDPGRAPRVLSRHAVPDDLLAVNLVATPETVPAHVQRALDHHRDGPWRAASKIATVDDERPGRLTSVLVGRSGSLLGYVEVLRDRSDEPGDAEWLVHGMISRMVTAMVRRHELDEKLRIAAEEDALTGLWNRRKLFIELEQVPSLAGSLIFMIDLDRFSWINNNLGHSVGDQALVDVANALVDMRPHGASVARLAGDEFVIWVPAEHADALADPRESGERIRLALRGPGKNVDRRARLRGSVGLVRVGEGESAAEALARADQAMYRSKREGGDRVTVA